MATTYDFQITQGAEFNTTFEVKNNSGTPYNLSGAAGYKLSGVAKLRYSDTNALVDLNPTPVSGFETSGRFNVTILASTTQTFPVSEGLYGIEIYSGDGTGQFVEKVVKGKFVVSPEVTSAGVTLPQAKIWLLQM